MRKKYNFFGKRFFMVKKSIKIVTTENRRKLLLNDFLVILLCLAFSINPSLGFCLPEGENVVSGSATFDRSQDNTLNINTPSESLIVNYNSFSIAQPEAVHFLQPSSSAIALNRVVGVDPSAIYGILTANGRIFLINPNGVLFGPGARVDAAGLVASTLDISNENFLAGNYNFFKNGLNSYIVNQGQITITNGGYAYLLAQGIDNQGSIKADLGKVVLASGEKMTLALDDLNEISVVVDEAVKNEVFGASADKMDSAVKNSGTIAADGGKVTLTAKALNTVFDYAINNTGVIQAKALVSNNGVVELLSEGAPIINIGKVAADGSIEAPDAGKISIEGPVVLQQGQVTANAEEAGKAGEISIVSQDQTTLGTGSLTEAKAQGLAGEGGSILIDSTAGDSVVNAGAVIDVSAGSDAGNAGRVEVSAFKVLDFSGIINGRAPLGYLGGVAILDPTDAIVSGTLNANTTIWATNDITIDDTVIIDGDFILNLFADHNSETAGDWEDGIGAILNPDNRRIEASAGTDTTINLKAGTGIGIDNPITTRGVHTITAEINPNLGAGDINLISDPADASLRLAGLFTPSGNITVENRNNVPIILDSVDFGLFPYAVETWDGSVSITNIGSIDIPGTNSDGISATGDITLLASDGTANITAGSEFGITAAQSIFGNISFEAGNNIYLGQVFSADILADEGNITLTAGNNVTLDNGSMASSTTGDITVTADNNISLGLLETAGDVTVTANTGTGMIIDNNGEGVNNISANDLFLTAALGINLDTIVDTLTASSTNTAITIREADGLAVNTVNAITGNIFLTLASGSLTDNNGATNNITGNNLTAIGASGINLDTNIESLIASVTEAGNILIDETNAITLTSIDTLDGSITITAGGAITATDVASLSDRDTNDISLTGVGIVAGLINAGNTGDVTLNAQTGGIAEDSDVQEDVIADNLQLSAEDGIDLDASINTLTASSTNTDITIREADDIAVNTVNAGIGNVDLSSALGSILDANAALNNITSNNLIVTAAGDIDLDTTVNSLDAILTAAGDLLINEADAITLTTLDIIDGSINITAGNTITAVDLLASAANGNITLSANTGDIAVNTLEAGNSVELTALSGAIIDDNAGSNNIISTNLIATGASGINLDTMVDTLTASTTNANITIREVDDIALNTVDAGTANVDLSSTSGAISDNNASNNNVSANTLTLTADTGIDLDIAVNSLDAIVSGTGDLLIDEADDITLTTLDVVDGNIVMTAGGAITANDLLALDTDADGIGGDISLSADSGDLSVDTLEADNTIDLSASLGSIVDLNGSGINNILSNNLILTADTGIDLDTTVNSLDAILTGNGDLVIDEADGITLTTIDAIDGDINVTAGGAIIASDLLALDTDADGIGGNIFLTANSSDISLGALSADYSVELLANLGAITDNNGAVNNVTANDLILTAALGIDLDTQIDFLNALATTGNINIANDSSLLTIDDSSLGAGFGAITDDGSVTISNTGSIDLPGTSADGIYATGDISLTSSTGNITAGSDNPLIAAWSDTGSITLNADSDIYLGEVFAADLLINSGSGSINLTTSIGDITLDNGTNINSIAGDITLTSGNDINLLETLLPGTLVISNASGDIMLDANNNISLGVLQTAGDIDLIALSGAISDNNGIANNIIANNLILTADTGIDLDTTVNSLDAILTGTGDLSINEFNAITLTMLDLVGGSIDITAGGAIVATELLTLDSNGSISLNAATGNITIGSIEAGDTITLTALGGSINEIGLGDADVDLTSSVINLIAKDEIGSAVDELDIEIDADTLSASSVNAKDIVITEANDVAIDAITTGGDLYLNSLLGSILDANAALNNITSNNLIVTAAGDIDLDTTVNTLDAIAGSLMIDEADAITLTALEILGGDINITAGNTITAVNLLALDVNGNITLTANTGDIAVDTLEAENSIELTALLGAITDNNAGNNNVSANTLTLTADTGIDLDTTVNSLDAIVSGTGDLLIDEADDMTLTTLDVIDGNINITAGGEIAVGGLLALDTGADGIGGDIVLDASGAITDNNAGNNNISANSLTLTTESGVDLDTDINSLDAIVNGTGDLLIDEADDIILTTLDVVDGSIVVTAGGAITANDLLALDTDADGIGGDISLSADSGDLSVDTLEADNTIDLSASLGSIVDLNGSGINNILSNNLILTANTGIDLDTTVNSLDAIVTGTGDLFINEADEISLIADVINGDINVNAGGTITASDLMALDTDADGIGGNIFLTASAGDLSLSTLSADYTVDLTSSLGAITDNNAGANNVTANELILTANLGIDLDGEVNFLNAQTTLGDIDISNDTDLLTIDDFSLGSGFGVITDDGSVTLANTGSIDIPGTNGDGIYATGGITLTSSNGNITAGSEEWITAAWSDNGSITLNADSDIYLGEIFAADLIISNGIGSINLTTTSGDITIDNGTNINSIAGDITLTSGRDINLLETLQGGTLIISDASGNINFDAASNISLGVLQTAGDVGLTATNGTISDNNGAANNITANGLTAAGAGGVDLDTTVSILTASSTNSDITIREADNLLVNTVNAGAGNVTLGLTSGAITDNNAAANNVTANDLTITAVSGIDLDTSVNTLTASSTNSDITIREVDGLTVNTVDAGAGNVSLNAASGAITDNNGAGNNVTADELTLSAASGISLDTMVSNLQATNIDGTIGLNNSGDLTLKDLGSLGYAISNNGEATITVHSLLTIADSILTNGRNLFLNADNGIMQEALGDIDTAGGSYTADADSNNDYAGIYRLASGGSIYTQDIDGNGGDIEITAADIDLGSGSLLEAGDGDISLIPSFDDITPLTIGLGNVAGDFRLTNDELDSLSTLGRVIIGNANSGNIVLDGVMPASFFDLELITGGNINDIDADISVTIASLTLNAGTGIGTITPLNINVDSLSASTETGSIFIEEANDISLGLLDAPDSIQFNANGAISDDNAGLTNIITPDLLITAGNGVGDLEDAIETEIETLDAYAANGGIFIDELDDLALNLVNAEGDDVMLSAGGSILDNDLGAAPDDFDIIGANIALDVGGHIGSSGEEEEVDLDLDSLVSLTENSRPDAPTDLNSLSHILGSWSNNNLVDVAWTAAINPNYYTGSDNSIAGYSFVWDNAAGTIPDEIQDIGEIASLDDILLGDSASNYLHIRSLNSSGNWSDPVHLGSFKIDTVAPEISATRNSGPNINGWYNSDVTVTFNGSDDLSGVDSVTGPILFSLEGVNQSASGTVTDLAGNSASVTETGINIDKTLPVISVTTPINGAVVANQQVLSFGVSDNLTAVPLLTGPASGTVFNDAGTQSILITATDLAGNISEELLTFTITSDFLESQISNATILNPFFFANPQTTGQFQVSSFDSVGSVFFYHPLTPVDMTAFDEMVMGEEVCEFIEGTICVKSQDVKSQDESPISQGTKKEDKKKEKK